MARTKSRWICQECGFQSSAFLGRCLECNNWNCLVEERATSMLGPAVAAGSTLQALDEIASTCKIRIATGFAGFDQVLGGGLVPGAVVLLAGDPGVGKSTILLQLSKHLSSAGKVIYISGEESAGQVKLRADRLGVSSNNILVDSQQNVETIARQIAESKACVAIIDSIQSVYHGDIASAPGSVSQVRESAAVIGQAARAHGIAAILVGHVTKDGSIAGPRVLEHLVDVVLQFEGERLRQLRVLRAAKNRFGSTAETAIFTMAENGLSEVDNPSALFLGERLSKLGYEKAPSGTAVVAGGEALKALLLEVQALVSPSAMPSPRRVANGWDTGRLLQILAVLEKRAGLPLSRHDVYVNIVGGFKFDDPAGDLGVSVAVATAFLDRSVDPRLICIGEVGLTGEVRPVSGLERQVKEAARLGFNRALVPAGNLPLPSTFDQIKLIGIEYLLEALAAVMPGQRFRPAPERQLPGLDSHICESIQTI